MKTMLGALIGAVGSTLACWRLILLLWLANAALAALVVAPLMGAVDATWRHSPLAPSLPGAFDDAAWVDFANVQAPALAAAEANAGAAALPWVVLCWLLSAAVLARVGDKPNFAGHLAAVGRCAHRYLWLLVMTGLGLAGVAWINGLLTGWVTHWLTLTLDRGAGAGLLGWSMTAKTLLSLLLAALVLGAGRVARLRVVKLDEKLMPLTWLRALGSLLRQVHRVGPAMLLALVPLALVVLAYRLVADGVLAAGWLDGSWASWRALALGQVAQLLVAAALVYRFAVDARLWPLLAPSGSGPGAAGAGGSLGSGPVPGADGAPTQPATDTPAPGQAPSPAPGEAPVAEGISDTDRDEPGSPATTALGVSLAALALLALAPVLTDDGASDPAPAAAPLAAGQDAGAAPRAERRHAYVMEVDLDPEARTATGRQRATFFNTTRDSVDELVLHLYAAAFGNTHTTWMQEGDPSEVTKRGEALGGTIDIGAVTVVEVLDGGGRRATLTGGLTPPDEVAIDDTLMRVSLGTPVPPGGSVTLDVRFVTRFPHVVARMGATGGHIDGMQWYPKFAVHDEDGWNAVPFHRRGEFFSDFGSYDITFRHPEEYEFEATGVPGAPRPDGEGHVTVRYRADDVHDFAFVVCPHAERVTETYSFLGPPRRDVEIVYLCQPYALPKADQVIELVKRCLDFSGTYWMPYPYDRLVIDGLPYGLGGGMEYPMLFTISQRFPNHLDALVDGTEDPAHVTAHEFGHEYWYGIVASNEFEEAWLDEGVNTWATNTLLDHALPMPGKADAATFLRREQVRRWLDGDLAMHLPFLGARGPAHVIGWKRSPFESPPPLPGSRLTLLGWRMPRLNRLRFDDMGFDRWAWERDRYYHDAAVLPLTTPSRDIDRGYGSLVYSKTSLVLKTLENHVGFDAMQAIMGRYVATWGFRHPTGDDFLSTVTEATGGAHDRWLHALIRTNGTIDFAVEQVETRFDPGPVGFTMQTRPGQPVTWNDPPVAQPRAETAEGPWFQDWLGAPDDAPAPPAPPAAAAGDGTGDPPAGTGAWVSRWVVSQPGGIEAPVTIESRYADGRVIRHTWDGRGERAAFEQRTNSRLLEVVVDPDRRFAIDLDLNNNGYRLAPADDACRSLKFTMHFRAQTALDLWALLF